MNKLASAMLLVPALMLVNVAGTMAAETKVAHKPLGYFVPEKRIRVEAKVTDPKGINLVRTYFKSDAHADYLFVPMTATTSDPNSYVGCVPAPAASAASMEYLFLSVNADKEVVKTAPAIKTGAKAGSEAPSWQMGCGEDKMTVWKELPELPSPTGAYADSLGFDVVESGARFGVVAGLFGGESSAAATAATGSSSAGTVAVASAATVSAGAIALGAVAVGAAAGGGGGGGSNDGSNEPPVSVQGSWRMVARCVGTTTNIWNILINLNESTGGTFSGSGASTDGSGMGMNLSGTYNSSSHFLSAVAVTTGISCDRSDTFSTTLTSSDTGYIPAQQSGNCGCDGEFRLIKQ